MHKDHGPSNGKARPPPPSSRARQQFDALPRELPDPLIGKTLRGTLQDQEYLIVRRVGKGGMGVVYEARQKNVARVAVKVMLDSVVTEENIDRFFREIGLNASVRHENVVKIFDFGEHEKGRPFLAEEFLDGKPVDEVLAEEGPMHWKKAADVMIKVLSGLGAVHAAGIIHRDMKPANIFMLNDGGVKILDFGLARNRGVDHSVTQSGMIMGTVHYLAPEQTGEGDYDNRVDIYASGIILYRMLCNVLPFSSKTDGFAGMAEVIRMHKEMQPVPPSQAAPGLGIPPEMEAIVLRAMEKDPAGRFQTAKEMRGALVQCLGRDPAAERKISLRGPAPQVLEMGAQRPPSGILIPSPTRSDVLGEGGKQRKKSSVVKKVELAVLVGLGALTLFYRDVIADYWEPKIVNWLRPEQQKVQRYEGYESRIDSDPSEAAVYEEIVENGKARKEYLGETPLKLRLEGDHAFIVEKEGYRTERISVTQDKPNVTLVLDSSSGGAGQQ